MPNLLPITYDQFVVDVMTLAERIEAGDWRPDYLVGIGRGGLTPAVYLSHRLDIMLLTIDHSAGRPALAEAELRELATLAGAGRTLLLVDDINDSGLTLTELGERLQQVGVPDGAVRAAVLVNNIRSRAEVHYWARAIDRQVEKDWFVFPWEALAPPAVILEDALAVPERIG